MDLKAYKGICVFVEQRYGEIQNVSLELIGKAKSLADELGEKVTAVIIGDEVMDKAEMLTHHGADKVIVIEDESLHHYTTEKYTQALVAAIEEKKPEIVMIGATSIGRDLGPRVSARLKTGLTADCTKLEISEERDLLMTRPAFGGNIMATIICTENRPQMATVRPGVMEKLAYDEARKGTIEVMNVAFEKNAADVEILEVLADEEERINIQDADILISGGRGVGGAERFVLLEELASTLGATVSASRAAVDSGWIAKDRQVGQTGQTVRPNLYFALGISGAIQHVAGMEEADFIVAINKDEGAPIFEVADVGIVGDIHKIVPELVTQLNLALANK